MERGIRKIFTFVKRAIATKIFRKKKNTEALMISESLKFPKHD